MELRKAIDKLFEMTDEQRLKVFGLSEVERVLNNYYIETIIKNIEDFCSEPKYGDVYVDDEGYKFILLSVDSGWVLSEKYKCPQKMNLEFIEKYYTKTGKNVADRLKGVFE